MKNIFKNYWAALIPIIILLCTGIFLLIKKSNTEDSKLKIVGMVDAEFIDISASLPGRIDRIKVKEGDEIHAGEVLAIMKDEEVNTIQQQALDAITIAENTKDLADRGAAPEVVESARNLQKIAQDQMVLMEKTYARFKNLYGEGVVSGQEYDLVKFRYQAAQKELETAKLNVELLAKGGNQQIRNKAAALVNQAKNAEKLTQQIKEKAIITSPISGIVSNLISKPGEMVNAGYPMMTIQKNNSYSISFNLRQDQMNKVEKGSLVHIKIPGVHPEEITARVSELAPALGFADFVPENQKGQFQLRTFKIKCTPVDMNKIKGLRVGMTAELVL
ncbi:MAG: efflux RND transporter periplasmic adaptor subunit [Bacteroidetes bacterium]|nr:efflux RND transporter periplasmic adaptor subunit [Bacteroidota bacterium]